MEAENGTKWYQPLILLFRACGAIGWMLPFCKLREVSESSSHHSIIMGCEYEAIKQMLQRPEWGGGGGGGKYRSEADTTQLLRSLCLLRMIYPGRRLIGNLKPSSIVSRDLHVVFFRLIHTASVCYLRPSAAGQVWNWNQVLLDWRYVSALPWVACVLPGTSSTLKHASVCSWCTPACWVHQAKYMLAWKRALRKETPE